MRRVAGVDVARGVASLLMIQGHAYHAWVAPEHRDAAYRFTRLLGTLPLPAFLVLAGAAMTWRLHAAVGRSESVHDVRRAMIRRGLSVVAVGYLVSGVYALMDGGGLRVMLRSDVLHVIGLSIALAAFVGARGEAGLVPRFAGRALALGALLTLACPWLSPLGRSVEFSFAGPFLALFVDVPGLTQMPVVPLFAWLAVGAGAAAAMLKPERDAFARVAGAPRKTLWAIAAMASLGVVLGSFATSLLHERLGGTLDRSHPAIVANVLDLAGRGTLVLALSALASPHLTARLRDALVFLGRGSLVAYVVHIPFCYGRLGSSWAGQLRMGSASLGLVLLIAFSGAAVWCWDRALAKRRLWRDPPTSAD